MELLTFTAFVYYIVTPSLLILIGLCLLTRKYSEPYPNTFCTNKEKQYFDPVKNKYETFPSISDKCSINLSVIIPAYEEESRLPQMLDECLTFLEFHKKKHKSFTYEVIIVNDGSKDKTSDVALKYVTKFTADKIRLLELETNRGKGGAVFMVSKNASIACHMSWQISEGVNNELLSIDGVVHFSGPKQLGVQYARGAVILFADADGATKFEDFVKLESSLQSLLKVDYKDNPIAVANSEAIICGSRAHLEKEASAKRSFFRTILMHGFHFLVWLFAVRSIRDTQCGFKLLTRRAAKLCFRSLHIRRWAFDVELLYIAEKYNVKIVEVAVRWTEIEGSKLVPFWSWLQMGRDLFLIWFRYKIGAWKLSDDDK